VFRCGRNCKKARTPGRGNDGSPGGTVLAGSSPLPPWSPRTSSPSGVPRRLSAFATALMDIPSEVQERSSRKMGMLGPARWGAGVDWQTPTSNSLHERQI
jgi:hypothetical protein